jgi:hypothetical protein
LTRWARHGINVDVVMKASGHRSVQMHKRYVDPQETDIAVTFGTSQIATGIVTDERLATAKQLIFLMEKEGARWCRWSSKPVWGS